MVETAAKKPRTKKAPAKAVEPVETIVAFKAFDKNLACTGGDKPFQYEVGKTYKMKAAPVICGRGFHACTEPLDVLNYYPLIGSRFAKVTLSGAVDTHKDGDSKICAASITIGAEIALPEFIKTAVQWIIKSAKTSVSTGDRSHAASTGDSSHAASTGDSSHAASTGDRSHAASTGNYSHAASTGDSSHAASTGYRSHAKTLGRNSVAASLWVGGTATAGEGGAIVLGYYDENQHPPKLLKVGAFMVGEHGIEACKTYSLNANGTPVEVAA